MIDAGANRQMAYLQQRATGEHAAFSQKILNEIAAARLCLLNPKQKSQYDAELNVKLAEKGQTLERPSPDLSEIASSPIADVLPTPTFPRLVRPARTRRSFQPKLWHYAVVIGVVGLFGIGGWAIFTSGHTSKQQVAISESEQAAVPQGKEAAAFSSGTPAAASPSQIGETKAMATCLAASPVSCENRCFRKLAERRRQRGLDRPVRWTYPGGMVRGLPELLKEPHQHVLASGP